MNNFNLPIPDNDVKIDFTIIYKGKESKESDKEIICEIQTSKDELIRKLRYFQQKTNEIKHLKDFYIHDVFPCKIFQDFIDSVITKNIPINDENYSTFYQLSTKYEYYELQAQIKSFIEKRPDLMVIMNDLSTMKNDDENKYDESDRLKEELISKNLDICLKSGNLNKIPIQSLVRILNSPTRVIKNHKLLYQFVINQLNNTNNNQNLHEIENLQILPSCLDYNEMSSDEIEELIKKELDFNPRNSNNAMKTLISQNKENQRKIDQLIHDFSELKQELANQQKIEEKLQFQENLIKTQQKTIQALEQKNSDFEKLFQQMNDRIHQLEVNSDEKHQKIINDLETKILNQEKKITSNFDSQNLEIQNIKTQLNIIIQSKFYKEFPYSENNEFKGIINYLRNKSDIFDEIDITSSSVNGSRKPQNVVLFENNDKDFCSKNIPNSWLCFDFKNHSIIPTSYTFRKRHSHCFPTGWIVEASNDNENWETIDVQNNPPFTKALDCASFNIKNITSKKFRFIRIKSTKPDSNDCNHLIIESFEFYGSFIK